MGTGKRIKETAKERGITLRKLAENAGVSYNTLYSITKRDSERIDPQILRRIAAALGVPLADLLPEPTEKEKAGLMDIVKEIGLPHGNGTVAETKALLQRVAEMYGEKSVVLIRLTSIMSDAGVDKVIEYTKSIFQEYMDEGISKTGEGPQNGGQSTPASQEGQSTTPPTGTPQGPQFAAPKGLPNDIG